MITNHCYNCVFKAQSDAQIDTLTSEQASSLVAHLNLGPIYTILQGKDRGPLSSIPGMDPLSIKEFTVMKNQKIVVLFHIKY